jgi:serine/threonine protein kinase
MPAPATTDELLAVIHKSELIPAQRLEAFVSSVADASPRASPREMAQLLIAAGLLTHFQAEQCLQGKWRGFTIGKYKVLERIGSGGMGTVYLCEHLKVGRRVAIKVLPTSQATNPSALGRFYREARASGVLDHPNLIKAHDIDQESGLHFLVMDYVDGANLQDIVAKTGPMDIVRAAHYIRQAALGLQHAHQAGLIHRDVKPANILLERSGNVRVLDLGLARFFNDNTDLLTLEYDERNVLGTADYVAPEQALNSHEVDGRADVYSLGASFYFLLTGQPPFAGGKVAQKLIWHQVRQPPPVRQLRPEVPEELATVLARMMAKNPAHRYQIPAEVAEALAPWTRAPIPPPPEHEMPQLSPAVAPTAGAAVTAVTTPRPTATALPPVPPSVPGAAAATLGGPRPVRAARGAPTAAMPASAAPPRAARVAPSTPRTADTSGLPLAHVAPSTSRSPAAAELAATPRQLASPQTPTETDRPRVPPVPVRPSDLMARLTDPTNPPAQPRRLLGAFLLLLAAGAVLGAGLALGWLF